MILKEHVINEQKIWQITEGNHVFSLAVDESCAVFHSSLKMTQQQLTTKGLTVLNMLNENTAVLAKIPTEEWGKILLLLAAKLINQL